MCTSSSSQILLHLWTSVQFVSCDMLSCEKPGKETDTKPPWVRSDVCGRWLHLLCVLLKKVSTKKDFVCSICEADPFWITPPPPTPDKNCFQIVTCVHNIYDVSTLRKWCFHNDC